MFTSPGEIAFHIGSLPIYHYGILMGIAITIGITCSYFITKKFYPELNPDVIIDIAPYIIIFAILGARIYYCSFAYGYYLSHPLEIIQIWHGGISIHGGIIGGLIGGIIYAKKHNLPILKLCDIFSYGLILGQAIGRWGNFFNSEAFGLPTNNFVKLFIPIYDRPFGYIQYSYFHPTFLYESILDILIFILLFFIIRKAAKEKTGIVFFSYLILYSIIRIIVEQIRIDSIFNVFGIPIAQIMSVSIIILATGLLLKRLNKTN